jgi:hypothetical protein
MKNIWIMMLIILSFSGIYGQDASDMGMNPAGAQKFVTVQGFIINSIGEFKDVWKSAGGFYIGYGKISTSDWALVLQTGYFNFTQNDANPYTGDPSFHVIPLMIGGRYYIARDLFQPFLLAMSGVNIISEKFTLDGKATDKTMGKLAFQVGAGVGVELSDNLAVEIAAKYNSHTIDPSLLYNMTGLEYGLGVIWFLHP